MKVKNILLKALIKCAKLQTPHEGGHRFLVVSTTGLGDTLWGTPAIRALRHSFPEAYIAVLTSPLGKALLENSSRIDELFVLEKPHLFSLFTLFSKLRSKKISEVLLFHASQRLIFPFCALLNPKKLIGTKGINKGLDSIFTHALEPQREHEIQRRLKIVQEIGAKVLDPSLEYELTLEDELQAEHFLKEQIGNSVQPLIGLHPGSKDGFKRWPEEHFIEVGNRLVQHLGCQILVTGDGAEKNLVERIAAKIPGAVAICGRLKLGPFAALIKHMSVMISNDTGPMHIAFAVKTPTVALFAPTDPQLCGPYFAPNSLAIAKKRTCTPCLRKKCAAPFCLLQISPQEVYDAAVKLFYEGRKSG